jgi:hypothetical protein
MKIAKIFTLCTMMAFGCTIAFAADCTNVEQARKFNPFGSDKENVIKVISAKGKPTDEIRRPVDAADGHVAQTDQEMQAREKQQDLNAIKNSSADNRTAEQKAADAEKERRLSVGLWCPMIEPPPCVRTYSNKIDGSKCQIFLNRNSATKAAFPYVVKDKATGEFFVFKNVKYAWKFEQVESENTVNGKSDRNNHPGETVLTVWYPWFEQKKTEEQSTVFIPAFGKDESPEPLHEKKVYANHHTTTYDSGIQGNNVIGNSSVLQQVLLTLSYEVAKVDVAGTVQGEGYPEAGFPTPTADPYEGEIKINGSVDVSEPLPEFKLATFSNPIPPAYAVKDSKNSNMWTLGEGSGYKLVYVEDYLAPAGGIAPYSGGPNADSTFVAKTGETLNRDIVIVTEDDNINANEQSNEMKAKLKYYLGNADVYKVENPFYGRGTQDIDKEPFLNFFYIKGNKWFGPYVAGVQKERWDEWYVGKPVPGEQPYKSPYWQNKPIKEAQQYVNTKLANSFPSKHIPKWQMGVAFVILGSDGMGQTGAAATDQLNDAWMNKSLASFTYFTDLKEEYEGLNSNAAKFALGCLNSLEKVLLDPNFAREAGIADDFRGVEMRKWLKFAKAGYDSGLGSFCVGPQELEKWIKTTGPKDENGVLYETVIDKPAEDGSGQTSKVLQQTWTIAKERILMPQCFCSKSLDSCKTDLFTSREVVQVVSADCCGTMTVSKPENTRDGMEISDEDSDTNFRTNPVPEMTLSNGQSESQVSVPSTYDLEDGAQLVVKENGSEIGRFSAGQYKEDFDLTKREFFVSKSGSALEPISFFDPTKPSDMVINEDERIEIKTGGYDNIDGMTTFRGLGKVELSIYDANGQAESLEYVDEAGNKRPPAAVVAKEMDPADPFKFTPEIRLFHVFRNPGVYKVEYTVYENKFKLNNNDVVVDSGVAPKSSKLTYNINVLDIKTKNRSLEDHNNRQN